MDVANVEYVFTVDQFFGRRNNRAIWSDLGHSCVLLTSDDDRLIALATTDLTY